MPLPRALGRINRYVANPVIRLFAGRVPPLAVLAHHGRRSGKRYRTPIMAFPAEGGYIIALVYGRDTDWERNLRAGGGELTYRGGTCEVGNARLVDPAHATPHLPRNVRFLLPRFGVHDFLRVDSV
jgi:deazaflavin-dependent oxidoreductase (nitroreductase family)